MIYDVQRRFTGYDRYWTNDWYRRHPGSWYPAYIPPTRWWYRPSWYDTWTWYGPGFFAGFVLGSASTPYPYYPYYYGNNIVYRGNMVYVNGVPYVSAADYYSQALVLAQSTETVVVETSVVVEQPVTVPIQLAEGPILEPPASEGMQQMVAKPVLNDNAEEWLPMGTFALLDDVTQEESGKILQLATNKSGQLRGNFVNEATGEAVQVRGAVDPKSQRVAFQFDGDDQTVLECGLWNLTQDSVPLLIHFDEERTEQKTLIRLTQTDETPENDNELEP